MKNIVVFASGSGTNFQAIIDACESGQIEEAQISGLIASKEGIQAIDRAQKSEISTAVLNREQFETEETFTDELLDQLSRWEADLIVLAGYLKKIPTPVIEKYRNRIINIHPSLLPKYGGKGYYGERVHRAVIENKEKYSGCTVHIVTEEYDKGPILAQKKVPVYSKDDPTTLASRILKEEHQLLPAVIQKLVKSNP